MSIVAEYLAHGWALVPIPPGSKGPRKRGWNQRGALLFRAEELTHDYGVGIAHAYSGTMAFDIDNWEETKTYGIDIDSLYAADDAVVIHSGREGHGKLLYKMPFGLVLPSKQIKIVKEYPFHVDRVLAFELRCARSDGTRTVQDVLPPTSHPETGQPYQWAGKGHWSRLPTIPIQLLQIWQELLKETVTTIAIDGIDASWEEIQEALVVISPDCSRADWIAVGMALQWAGVKTLREAEAFSIWDTWSRLSVTKYPGDREILTQWRSFKAERESPVTLGTLFHIARQYGWERDTPDASDLFTSTETVMSPDSITQGLQPLPPEIDLTTWPEILRVRAQEVSDSVGCDPLVPLFAGLAAVCGVIDARMRLELMPGFKVPPVLWLMTLGDPADKKSPGSRPMLEPLKAIEVEDRPRYQKDVLDWEAREAAFSVAKKAFLDFAISPEALLGEKPPDVPELPVAPVPIKITVSDITSQKLVRHASDRPRGLLCHLDEMHGWIRKICDRSSGDDRSTWVASYESERHEVDRVGAGSIHCENLAVSIYGNIQPDVFRENLESLAMDGLLQRFIPAVLRHGKTRLGKPSPDFMTHAQSWENTLRMIFALPPMTYKLDESAYKVYRKFQEWYEERKEDERLLHASPIYMTAFGKVEGLAGRLILLFHVIETPFLPTVDVETVKRVVQLIKRYVIPAYRYALGEIGDLNRIEIWLTDHLIQYADQEKINLEGLYRSSRNHIASIGATTYQRKLTVVLAMHVFEQSKWVARCDDKRDDMKAEWLINPALKTMFKQYREKVVRAKQRFMDDVKASSRENFDTPGRIVVHGLREVEDLP